MNCMAFNAKHVIDMMGGCRCLRKISATSEEGWSKRQHDTAAFIIIIIIFIITISSTGVNTERSRRSNEWERIG